VNRFFTCIALFCFLPIAQAKAQSSNPDSNPRILDDYSPIIEWRRPSGLDVTPIHAGLLPNGELFFVNAYNFFENPQMNLGVPGFEPEYLFVMKPTPAHSTPPASVLIQPLVNPSPLSPLFDTRTNTIRFKTLACSGHSLMADGNLFFASGADAIVDLNLYNSGNLFQSLTVDGIAESVTYNPFSSTWITNPITIVPGPLTGRPLRWYATVTRLADSRMLITGGYEKVFPSLSYNPSVEIFDPVTNRPVMSNSTTPWVSRIRITPMCFNIPTFMTTPQPEPTRILS
jgi:hypothetical protein